jgi:segregation and condensation protein B
MRDVSPKEVKKMASQLNAKYERENAAYRIVIENGNFSMKLTDDLEFVQNHFYGRDRTVRLSQAATDALAVIAYNQPVSREQVEKICGKPMGAILNQLVRRGLLDLEPSAGKRSNNVYRTTERFLNLFGLETIEDLPRASTVSDLEELED